VQVEAVIASSCPCTAFAALQSQRTDKCRGEFIVIEPNFAAIGTTVRLIRLEWAQAIGDPVGLRTDVGRSYRYVAADNGTNGIGIIVVVRVIIALVFLPIPAGRVFDF